jgi:hypothetical protein
VERDRTRCQNGAASEGDGPLPWLGLGRGLLPAASAGLSRRFDSSGEHGVTLPPILLRARGSSAGLETEEDHEGLRARRKGDRWYAVIYEGVDPATGKERRSWHAAGTERADAERLAATLATQANRRHDKGASNDVRRLPPVAVAAGRVVGRLPMSSELLSRQDSSRRKENL